MKLTSESSDNEIVPRTLQVPPVETGPKYKLFNSHQVAWASFVGSFLGGAFVMALNYKRTGQGSKAKRVILLGVLATLALVILAAVAPEEFPDSLYNIVVTFLTVWAARVYAEAHQGKELQEHLSRGGLWESGWRSFFLGLGGAILIGTFFVLVLLGTGHLESTIGPRVEFGQSAVYYKGTARKNDAKILGYQLQKIGVFDSDTSINVTLVAEGNTRTIVFTASEGATLDEDLKDFLKGIKTELAPRYKAKELFVELVDHEGKQLGKF